VTKHSCGGGGSRLAMFSEVKQDDVDELMTIYSDDMRKFGYTWSQTTLTAECRARIGTAHYCC